MFSNDARFGENPDNSRVLSRHRPGIPNDSLFVQKRTKSGGVAKTSNDMGITIRRVGKPAAKSKWEEGGDGRGAGYGRTCDTLHHS